VKLGKGEGIRDGGKYALAIGETQLKKKEERKRKNHKTQREDKKHHVCEQKLQ